MYTSSVESIKQLNVSGFRFQVSGFRLKLSLSEQGAADSGIDTEIDLLDQTMQIIRPSA